MGVQGAVSTRSRAIDRSITGHELGSGHRVRFGRHHRLSRRGRARRGQGRRSSPSSRVPGPVGDGPHGKGTGEAVSWVDHSFRRGCRGNGSVLVGLDRHRWLAEPVNRALADSLEQRGVCLNRGEVLLAMSAEHDAVVLREVTDRGLDCVLLRNRGELMVLPAGVSKGSGLLAALDLFGLSAHNAIAVGDAENDHAMFDVAELAAATANAVPSVKEHADLVLEEPNGAGVIGLLGGPIMDGEQGSTSVRRRVRVGAFADGSPTLLPSTCATVMIVGGSGRGKSYLAGVVTEQLLDAGYQVLVVDPEGEQSALGDLPNVEIVQAADSTEADQIAQRLHRGHSVVLDLSAIGPPTRM